jgi:error-prone DNA polymerase
VSERERSGLYCGIADLASRSGVGRDGLERLAWAGALDTLPVAGPAAAHRREGVWRLGVAGTSRTTAGATQIALPLEPPDAPPELEPLSAWQLAVENYRTTGVNLGDHPLGLMRGSLGAATRSCDLGRVEHGVGVEVAGMVVARQRPETAHGITFMLLEDEKGVVNLIVGSAVYERSREAVRSAPLVRACGRLERREGVVNVLVAEIRALDSPPTVHNQAAAQRVRQRAVDQLRAVAPRGHMFGRR